jgi:hypothetical protein
LAAEIRRRKVLRVVTIYALSVWLVLQIAEVVFEPLGMPDWSMRALIIAALAGFPISFVLAWVIDIRPTGLIFDLPLWSGSEEQERIHKKSDPFYAALLALLLAGLNTSSLNRSRPSIR